MFTSSLYIVCDLFIFLLIQNGTRGPVFCCQRVSNDILIIFYVVIRLTEVILLNRRYCVSSVILSSCPI